MKALCVIDLQNDFVNMLCKNPLTKDKVDVFLKEVQTQIQAAESNQQEILFVRQVHRSFLARVAAKLFANNAAIFGTPGADVIAPLSSFIKRCFDKEFRSAFSNPDFSHHLKEKQITELQLIGLDLSYCIYSTAMDALDLGLSVHIIERACITQKPNDWKNKRQQLLNKNCNF